jgi:F-type H+-transporting ATPase subunit b
MTAPMFLAGSAGLLSLNGTLIADILGFLVMLFLLWRYAYPVIVRAAEARQRQVTEQLESARREREEAEERLKDAAKQLDEARLQASEVLAGANRSADQLRAEARSRAEDDAHRIVDGARREIESERQRALQSVRQEVADLVVGATEKVVGRALDADAHRRLIDEAIEEVGVSGGNGAEHHS